MKLLAFSLAVLTLLSLLSACSGPSKEELLRLQLLQAQQAEAAAEAERQAAAAREQRVEQRLQQALQVAKQQRTLTPAEVPQLLKPGQIPATGATQFFSLELQPAKYNYGANKQSFSVVGMRQSRNETVLAGLGQQLAADALLEWLLWQETELNTLGQTVAREGGQRLTAVTGDVRRDASLRSFSQQWQWEDSLFEDISWHTSPEQAWALTSGRDVRLQLGVRLCPLADCRHQYSYRNQPTTAVRADILSVLIVDGRNHEVLAEFIRAAE